MLKPILLYTYNAMQIFADKKSKNAVGLFKTSTMQ